MSRTPTPSRLRRRLAVALVGCVALTAAVGTGTAGAATPQRTPFVAAKAECNRKITNRVVALADLRAKASATRPLDESDKSEMLASIDETTAVLQQMYRPAVNGATTRSALKAACQSVFVDLRIFAVYLPQVRYSGMLDALEDFQDRLQAQVTEAAAGGTDTAAWQALLDAATPKLDDAATRIPSVTPASFNTDPAGTRATWDAVHADLLGAFGDLLQVHRALHPAV